MNTIVLSNVPDATMARLADQATKTNQTVEAVALEWLAEKPGDADTGPLDFPRPLTTPAVRVRAVTGRDRLPACPVILDPTPE